jgi:hypothetical protein
MSKGSAYLGVDVKVLNSFAKGISETMPWCLIKLKQIFWLTVTSVVIPSLGPSWCSFAGKDPPLVQRCLHHYPR